MASTATNGNNSAKRTERASKGSLTYITGTYTEKQLPTNRTAAPVNSFELPGGTAGMNIRGRDNDDKGNSGGDVPVGDCENSWKLRWCAGEGGRQTHWFNRVAWP